HVQVREVQRHAGAGRGVRLVPVAVCPDGRPPAFSQRGGNVGVNHVVPVAMNFGDSARVNGPGDVAGDLPRAALGSGRHVQSRVGSRCGVSGEIVRVVAAYAPKDLHLVVDVVVGAI